MLVQDWHILTFAGLTGDFFDVHMDDRFAQELGFDGRIAHGLLGLALVDGLKNRAEVRLAAVASLSWTWDFRAPIRPGDRIHAEITLEEVLPVAQQARPRRGQAPVPRAEPGGHAGAGGAELAADAAPPGLTD